jgi:hypothetical protein
MKKWLQNRDEINMKCRAKKEGHYQSARSQKQGKNISRGERELPRSPRPTFSRKGRREQRTSSHWKTLPRNGKNTEKKMELQGSYTPL